MFKYVDILVITVTKFDDTFPTSHFLGNGLFVFDKLERERELCFTFEMMSCKQVLQDGFEALSLNRVLEDYYLEHITHHLKVSHN